MQTWTWQLCLSSWLQGGHLDNVGYAHADYFKMTMKTNTQHKVFSWEPCRPLRTHGQIKHTEASVWEKCNSEQPSDPVVLALGTAHWTVSFLVNEPDYWNKDALLVTSLCLLFCVICVLFLSQRILKMFAHPKPASLLLLRMRAESVPIT